LEFFVAINQDTKSVLERNVCVMATTKSTRGRSAKLIFGREWVFCIPDSRSFFHFYSELDFTFDQNHQPYSFNNEGQSQISVTRRK